MSRQNGLEEQCDVAICFVGAHDTHVNDLLFKRGV